MPDNRPGLRRLSAIRPVKDNSFIGNHGVGKVKRVEVVDGVEQVFVDEIPITTARLDITRKAFSSDSAPKPPTETRLVPSGSDEGRAAGLNKDTICVVPRLDDAKYRKDLEEWAEKMMWSIVAEAIDIELIYVTPANEERPAETTAEKVTALKQAGYQQSHIAEMMQDIQRIAAFSDEERRRFFGGN